MELAGLVLQQPHLLEELGADGSGLFTAGGVRLDDGGNLADPLRYLADGDGLPLNCLGDDPNLPVGLGDELQRLAQGMGDLPHNLTAPFRGLDGVVNQLLGSLGGLVGLGRQGAPR